MLALSTRALGFVALRTLAVTPPPSGWTIGDALGVNDHGEIVGNGYYNGALYGISLEPPN